MGEVIKTIRRNCYLLLLASCFLMSCSSYGTEVGNPGQRNVTGNLETTTSDLITASLTTQQYTTVNSTSCPSSNGDITVGLRNRDGSITSQSLDDGFSFLTEILNVLSALISPLALSASMITLVDLSNVVVFLSYVVVLSSVEKVPNPGTPWILPSDDNVSPCGNPLVEPGLTL